MPKTRLTHTTMAHLRDWNSIKKLKACPLCGCLNVSENDECFACRWSGQFETDGRLVRLRLAELALRQPELRELWRPANRTNLFQRIVAAMRQALRRPVDYRI